MSAAAAEPAVSRRQGCFVDRDYGSLRGCSWKAKGLLGVLQWGALAGIEYSGCRDGEIALPTHVL